MYPSGEFGDHVAQLVQLPQRTLYQLGQTTDHERSCRERESDKEKIPECDPALAIKSDNDKQMFDIDSSIKDFNY